MNKYSFWDKKTKEGISEIQREFSISKLAAEFIYDQKDIPLVNEYPKDIKDEDIIQVLMKDRDISEDFASEIVGIERHQMPAIYIEGK